MNKFLIAGLMAFLPSVALADEASLATAKAFAAQYDKMHNEHNLKGLIGMYIPNAMYLPAVAPAIVGQDGITKFYEPFFNNLSNHVITIDAAEQVAPNVIVTQSHWVTDMKDDKGVQHLKGYGTNTMVKVGNDWKLAALAWSTPKEEPAKEASK